MLRVLRSMVRGSGEWEREVDLSVPGTLASYGVEAYALLPIPQRNALLARFVSTVAGISEAEAASGVGGMLGLSFGTGRLGARVAEAWGSGRNELSMELRTALDGEILIGARAATERASSATLRSLAGFHGGVTEDVAAEVALRSRRVRALGGRTLGLGIRAALGGELAPLAPIAPAGPIRLQSGSLLEELTSVSDPATDWALPREPTEQADRNRMAILLADSGFVPRLAGTHIVLGDRMWLFGIEVDGADLSGLFPTLVPLLREVQPKELRQYAFAGFALVNGPVLAAVVKVPASAVADALEGRRMVSSLREDGAVHKIDRPLSECLRTNLRGDTSAPTPAAGVTDMSELDMFVADVRSGFSSNWLSLLSRTIGGKGLAAQEYKSALGRVQRLAAQAEHVALVREAQHRALAAARPMIVRSMEELSRMEPGAEATETMRVGTCEHFTRWAATALVLAPKIDAADQRALLDPFRDVRGMGSRS